MLQKYLDFLNSERTLKKLSDIPNNLTVHSDIYYITNLLNAKFKKTYTFDEVTKLLQEEMIPQQKPVIDYVPQWYKDKWFK
jgi:hypothetical protein